MDIGVPQVIVGLVAIQRVLELWVARRNTRRLLASGGHEVGAGHYPLFVMLHGAWLATLFLLVPADAPVGWVWIAAFVVLQIGRLWVIVTLGRYWTTRIITVPGAPLVRHGLYRFVHHPNYWIVSLELPLLPVAFGCWDLAVLFCVLNLALLRHRIRLEKAALNERRSVP